MFDITIIDDAPDKIKIFAKKIQKIFVFVAPSLILTKQNADAIMKKSAFCSVFF